MIFPAYIQGLSCYSQTNERITMRWLPPVIRMNERRWDRCNVNEEGI